MVAGQGPLAPSGRHLSDFRWWLDVQPRFSVDADGLRQTLVRPGLGYAFGGSAAGWLGYAWILTEREQGGHSEEHRIWQQMTWSLGIEQVSLSSRTRLEQRFLDTGDDVGWRARQFVKGTVPLHSKSRFYLSVYDELFIDLNDTDWGQNSGVSQNRLFLGLGWKLDVPSLGGAPSIEAGYLNQFVNNPTRSDQLNHILSLNLFLNF